MVKRLLTLTVVVVLCLTTPAWAENTPPVADAGEDQLIFVSQTTKLWGSASDPDGDSIVAWSWAIEEAPGGSTAAVSPPFVPDPYFTPDVEGEYLLSLTVYDGTDWSAKDTVTITAMENLPPVAVAVADKTSGPAPLTVNFDGTQCYDPEGADLSYTWNFGDTSLPSNAVSPQHTYQVPGTYLAKVLVTDDWGQRASDSIEITIHLPYVSPLTVEFGNLEVGDSSTAIVTTTNTKSSGTLKVTDVSLTSSSSSTFSISGSYSWPVTLDPGDSVDVVVAFDPDTTDTFTGTLVVTTDDATIDVSLIGTGVQTQPSLPDMIDDILAFFDQSVDDGTLYGLGSGNSADNRRDALRNMIEAAGDLIVDEEYERAYGQLAAALKKTDGEDKPPDFVGGSSADDLAGMILEVMAELD
jgi:PKD repeat protein